MTRSNLRREARPNLAGRIARNDSIWTNVARYDGTGSDNSAAAYRDPTEDDGAIADPDVGTDDYAVTVVLRIIGVADPRGAPNGLADHSVIVIVPAHDAHRIGNHDFVANLAIALYGAELADIDRAPNGKSP